MLTLFACPKPFAGHVAVIQHNAIRSWTLLGEGCEVLLFGDEDGAEAAAARHGVRHVASVARNEFGTPLISSLFEQARRLGSHDLLCYVNADIILTPDLLATARRLRETTPRFLMVGQRWDVDLTQPWPFNDPRWESKLRAFVRSHGALHPQTGMDYFVFPRDLFDQLPPFALGRPGWDNWLPCHAMQRGALVVDATACVTAVHQNHDYAHVGGVDEAWNGPEARRNRELMGKSCFTLDQAEHVLTADGQRAVGLPRHPSATVA